MVSAMQSKRLKTMVDTLGMLKAQIAELQKQEESLREALVESGVSKIEGSLFRVTVSTFPCTRIDYQAIVEHLQPKNSLIAKYTSVADRTTVRVVARNNQ